VYPQQAEKVNQKLFILENQRQTPYCTLINKIYFRRHYDKFLLDRHDPSLYTNYHTTYLYGLGLEIDFSGSEFLGVAFHKEKITSTNLDRHSRQRKEISLGIRSLEIGRFLMKLALNQAYYDQFNWQQTIDFSTTYATSNNIDINFLFHHDWRAPSFTELFYSSPVNIGNSNLGIQEGDNFELNLAYKFIPTSKLQAGLFYRRQQDTIDWIKNNYSDPWQAKNTGTLEAKGADFNLQFIFDNSWLDKASLGYTYLLLDRDNSYNYSKYVFNYMQHKMIATLGFDIKGVSADIMGLFNKPFHKRGYFVCDFRVRKDISANMNIFFEVKNILNSGFDEMQGIKAPGRWYGIGFDLRF
jgi:iron complex outermembrane receptor protein